MDYVVLNFIQHIKCGFLDTLMPFITHLGDKGIFWIALGIILACIKKTRKTGVSMLLSLLICFVVANIIMKPLIARERPFAGLDINLLIKSPTDYSFPSGHTASSFAAATAYCLNNKKCCIFVVALAVLIAFSRLYLYVHFPSDVVAGCVVGIASAYVAKIIMEHQKLI